jgi:hypothetical protein
MENIDYYHLYKKYKNKYKNKNKNKNKNKKQQKTHRKMSQMGGADAGDSNTNINNEKNKKKSIGALGNQANQDTIYFHYDNSYVELPHDLQRNNEERQQFTAYKTIDVNLTIETQGELPKVYRPNILLQLLKQAIQNNIEANWEPVSSLFYKKDDTKMVKIIDKDTVTSYFNPPLQ